MFSRIPTLHKLILVRIRMLVIIVANLVAEAVEDVPVIVLCSAISARSLDMWLQIVGTSPQLLHLLTA